MSWAVGYDSSWERDIGYGVPAMCDHPDCVVEITRGLANVCAEQQPYGGESGCGLYFCEKHRDADGFCERCAYNLTLDGEPDERYKEMFAAKQDIPEWMKFKLTDSSWGPWRAENRRKVRHMQEALKATAP